jgi:hypothetical protein
MCVCVYVCVRACVSVCAFLFEYMHVCVHVTKFVCICALKKYLRVNKLCWKGLSGARVSQDGGTGKLLITKWWNRKKYV